MIRALLLKSTAALALASFVLGQPASAEPLGPQDQSQTEAVNDAGSLTFYESAHPDQTAFEIIEADLVADDPQLKSVLDRSKSLVGLAQPIKVCFMDGLPAQHEMIISAAQAWAETGAGIAFDFGEGIRNACIRDTAEDVSVIRITTRGTRNYSLIGREAFASKYAGKATMGIGFDQGMQRPLRRAIIQHEFGHALGLLHEHLNPAASCVDEFDRDAIYAALVTPDGEYTKEDVDRDFLAMLRGSPEIVNSDFDEHSIMIYALADAFFENPATASCKVRQPLELSQIDRDEIKRHYPFDPEEAARLARDIFVDLQLRVLSSDLTKSQQDRLLTYSAGFASITAPEFGGEYLDYVDRLIPEGEARE